jgi:hypothetical protein
MQRETHVVSAPLTRWNMRFERLATASARCLARTRRASPRIGVGVAIGFCFRRVLRGRLLGFLDRRMLSRRVRFRGAIIGVRVDGGLDVRAPTAAAATVRRFDCAFVPGPAWILLHGVHPLQIENLRFDSRKRHAKRWGRVRAAGPARFRRFYNRPVVYCNPDCKSCRGARCPGARCRVRARLARRLRRTARRASGTLGSFSPPMNRVRYTRRTCSTLFD